MVLAGVGEHDEVLVAVLGDLALDLPAGGVVRQAIAGFGWANVGDQPLLLGQGLKLDLLAGDGHRQIAGREVPPQFLRENAGEIGLPQPVLYGFLVDLHG